MDPTTEISSLQLDKMCRLCLSTSLDFIPIFDYGVITIGLSLKDRIEECSAVVVQENDGLPQNICGSCYNKVNDWYDFKNCCKKTQVTLLQYVSDSGQLVPKSEKNELQIKQSKNDENDDCRVYSEETVDDAAVKSDDVKETTEVHIKDTVEDNLSETVEDSQGDTAGSFSDLDDKPLSEVKLMVKSRKQINRESKLKSKVSTKSNEKSGARGRSPKAKPVCVMCKAKFSRFTELIEHQMNKHNITVSNMNFKTENAYEHLGSNKDAFAVYKCHICKDGKEFSGRKELRNHCKSIHNTKIIQPYPCGHCDRQFSAWGLLVIHERKHTGEKPFSCDLCGKKNFISQTSLRRHKLMHLKVYNCHECNRDFNCDSALRAHIRCKHTNEKPYLCNICGRSFSLSAILVAHMTSHSSERKYVCDVCGFASKTSGNHHRHKNTHNTGGVKSFHCETCGKSFESKLKLTSHQIIHRPVRPHVCKVCGKGFLYKNKLERHVLLVHAKERPFPCTICGKKLASKFGLGIHMKTHSNRMPLLRKVEPATTEPAISS